MNQSPEPLADSGDVISQSAGKKVGRRTQNKMDQRKPRSQKQKVLLKIQGQSFHLFLDKRTGYGNQNCGQFSNATQLDDLGKASSSYF